MTAYNATMIEHFKDMVLMNLDDGFGSDESIDRAYAAFHESDRFKLAKALHHIKGMKIDIGHVNRRIPNGYGSTNYMIRLKDDAVIVAIVLEATNCTIEHKTKRGTDKRGNLYVPIGGAE